MQSMNDELLKSQYRRATSALPTDADHRINAGELLALAAGQNLGARHLAVLQGLAQSSVQARAVQLLAASREWSAELSAELNAAAQPPLLERLQRWWNQLGWAPMLASAAIVLMAISGARLMHPQTLINHPNMAVMPTESPLFRGEFEPGDQLFAASLETAEAPDHLFGGNFDS